MGTFRKTKEPRYLRKGVSDDDKRHLQADFGWSSKSNTLMLESNDPAFLNLALEALVLIASTVL